MLEPSWGWRDWGLWGLAGSIQTAGPLGALLDLATIGLIVCAVQFALGEVTAHLPVTGSFVHHAEFLADPALGFAIGYNIVYGNWLSIPTEISDICVLFQYWTDVNSAVWAILAIALTFAVGIAFIGIYGEVEFWFALLSRARLAVLHPRRANRGHARCKRRPAPGQRLWHCGLESVCDRG